MKLNIQYPNDMLHTQCRFCKKIYNEKCALTKHVKICKAKKQYRTKLEDQLKT